MVYPSFWHVDIAATKLLVFCLCLFTYLRVRVFHCVDTDLLSTMIHGNKTPAHVHEREGLLGRLYSIYHHIVYWAGPNPHWRILTRVLVVGAWLGVVWAILREAALPKRSEPTDYIHCVRATNVTESGNDTITSACDDTEMDNVSIVGMFDNLSIGYSFVDCCVNRINLVVQDDMTDQTLGMIDVFHNATELPVKESPESIVTKDGQVFALVVLLMASAFGGFVARALRLPSLFGMLIVGVMLRNIHGIAVAEDIDHDLASMIRSIALVLILTRGGLSLDVTALRKLKFGIMRLAFLPCLCEGLIEGLVAHFVLDIPWIWSFMLGFVLSAISPSILIPGLLNLQEHGFGTNKGIPSLLIASATLDDVLSISLFGILLGVIFATGSIWFTVFRGPLEIAMGLTYGIVFGLICWQVPHRHDMKKGSRNRNRLAIITGLALFGYFGATKTEVYGTGFLAAGPLAVIMVSFVASIGWKKSGKILVNRSLVIIWKFFQPLLFGLIGAEVDFSAITGDELARGIAVLACGATARVIAVCFAVQGNKLNIKETIFVMIAWLPKATVQAAIGSAALDQAMKSGTQQEEEYGQTVLTIALLDIMIFGPIGALSIGLLGPHLLTQEGHHHVHIEHNIEGEVDITGNIESESESESSDDEEYETGDDPGYESLKRHITTLQETPSIEAPEFHCCVDCARLQDHLRIDCFRHMIEHEYITDKHILTSKIPHSSVCSSESQSYVSVQEDNAEVSPTIPPSSDITGTQLIEKKHHKFPFLHHLHLPGKHHHHPHHSHSHHGHLHHGHSHHGHSHRRSSMPSSSNHPSGSSMTANVHVEVETTFTNESNDARRASNEASNHTKPDDEVCFQIGQSTEV